MVFLQQFHGSHFVLLLVKLRSHTQEMFVLRRATVMPHREPQSATSRPSRLGSPHPGCTKCDSVALNQCRNAVRHPVAPRSVIDLRHRRFAKSGSSANRTRHTSCSTANAGRYFAWAGFAAGADREVLLPDPATIETREHHMAITYRSNVIRYDDYDLDDTEMGQMSGMDDRSGARSAGSRTAGLKTTAARKKKPSSRSRSMRGAKKAASKTASKTSSRSKASAGKSKTLRSAKKSSSKRVTTSKSARSQT